MKILFLVAASMLVPNFLSAQHHDELDHVVEALNHQLEALHFLAEAKHATDQGLHDEAEYKEIIDGSHHIQEYLVSSLAEFKRTRNMPRFKQRLRHVQKDLMELMSHLNHFNDRTFDAANTLINDLWHYAKLIVGVPNTNTARCTIRHSSAFFPSTTVACTHLPRHFRQWRLSWGAGVHTEQRHGYIAQSATQFSQNVGRIGGNLNTYKLELVDVHGHATTVRLNPR